MRNIIFRGRRSDDREFVYGDLDQFCHADTCIMDREGYLHGVDADTVGQYTGINDKNGRRIFEGDRIKGLFYHHQSITGTVSFCNGAFGVAWQRGDAVMHTPFTSTCNITWEVVDEEDV